MKPIIGLFGSNAGDWRKQAEAALLAADLNFFKPRNTAWQAINSQNGDQMQSEIDRLVALQHQGIHQSTCVLFQLDTFDPKTNKPFPRLPHAAN